MKFNAFPYHHSDYQRQFGGIDPKRINEILREEGLKVLQTEKYCARESARDYILEEDFSRQNIELEYQKYEHPIYPQRKRSLNNAG